MLLTRTRSNCSCYRWSRRPLGRLLIIMFQCGSCTLRQCRRDISPSVSTVRRANVTLSKSYNNSIENLIQDLREHRELLILSARSSSSTAQITTRCSLFEKMWMQQALLSQVACVEDCCKKINRQTASYIPLKLQFQNYTYISSSYFIMLYIDL